MDSAQLSADMIIFDCPLTSAQAHSIAEETNVEVLDRNQLILAIFGQRARSQVGRLQVELASLRYELPRLHKKFEGLSRITGGIGATGPGETKLEIHRRRVRQRISHLEKQIERHTRQRQLSRRRRQERGVPVVSIVGYTNSGKSTLFNRMTASEVTAEDLLFATLDPTRRRVSFGQGREFVLADTVGFIRDLPRELMQAFEATLEELSEAVLLVHLVDLANPDHDEQVESVHQILESLDLHRLPRLVVYNKCDRLEELGVDIVEEAEGPLFVSARTGKNVPRLLETICRSLWPLETPLIRQAREP